MADSSAVAIAAVGCAAANEDVDRLVSHAAQMDEDILADTTEQVVVPAGDRVEGSPTDIVEIRFVEKPKFVA